ncbi:MAG: K(+)-transporting ATPase subunit F [Bdellovibrionales bacterium]|nr:K(+)-transporting ATPase subunit F [Bdellovibrionales bacterium]
MSFLIAGFLSLLLLIYLFYALFNPNKF